MFGIIKTDDYIGACFMFHYLNHRHSFLMRLRNYLNNHIIMQQGNLVTPFVLNHLDRQKLAHSFYDRIPSNLIEGVLSKEVLIKDLAIYIDDHLPELYSKKCPHTIERDELYYHYPANQKKRIH